MANCRMPEGEVLLIDYEVIVESCHLELESGILQVVNNEIFGDRALGVGTKNGKS